MNTVKANTPTSKPLINTAAIEQQLFKRQQIAEDLKVSTQRRFSFLYTYLYFL